MKEHPILFKGDMVRAILDGRKTQTRRVFKEIADRNKVGGWLKITDWDVDELTGEWYAMESGCGLGPFRCPYGVPGDRLLIKESYRITDVSPKGWALFDYIADGKHGGCQLTPAEFAKWNARKKPYAVTSGRFMYNSLIRFKPIVSKVRVERVQEITDRDAIAEGVDRIAGLELPAFEAYWTLFKTLWDSINKKRGYGWDQNNWVWCVEFKLLESK